MTQSPLYAEVIIPLAIKSTFTYLVPDGMDEQATAGMRVIVQFGKQKLYSGIIQEVHHRKPEEFEPREIISFLDDRPIVNDIQLQFWKWISGYYMCSIGEVMNAALPGGLKLASETVLEISETGVGEGLPDEQESLMLEHLQGERQIRLDDIRKGPFGDDGLPIVKRMVEKGILVTDQKMKRAFKPRKISCIGLTQKFEDEKTFGELLDQLGKAPLQVRALETYVQLSKQFSEATPRTVERRELTAEGVAASAVTSLIKKGVFRKWEQTVSRIHHDATDEEVRDPFKLASFQEEALTEVREQLSKFPAVLLHGVTSSGKTELYIHLIREQMEMGKQVLYLLPEIALTTQIIRRLKNVFGNNIGVYHSRYSDNERVEVYRNLAGLTEKEPCQLILGVRSAVFLPFGNLGLVIIDEEHENTYKQYDPAPRYHARDAATILALFTGAGVLMGSATPSFETLYNSKTGKYGKVELNQRFGDVALPEVVVADVARAQKRKQLKAHFTPELLDALQETLERGEQAILFQNRRGFSNYLHCADCGTIVKCGNCDVSLTYHKFGNEMVCHYCGFKTPVPVSCPECNSGKLVMRGFGTEKVEDEIAALFPEAKVGRMDLDKTRSRKAFERVIGDFEAGRSHILVGTQLVTKGLDFENVSLVGVIDADSMLNFPDFRAFERSFQLMVQVSGRAGRRKRQGRVVIQTMDPTHPVLQHVLEGGFAEFFKAQMQERKMFRYPPFVRLIRITLRHEIPSILDGGSVFLANELRELFGRRVLGPQEPVVSRTHGKYIRQILLKIEKEASVEKAKALTGELVDIFMKNPVYRQIRLNVDVDPA